MNRIGGGLLNKSPSSGVLQIKNDAEKFGPDLLLANGINNSTLSSQLIPGATNPIYSMVPQSRINSRQPYNLEIKIAPTKTVADAFLRIQLAETKTYRISYWEKCVNCFSLGTLFYLDDWSKLGGLLLSQETEWTYKEIYLTFLEASGYFALMASGTEGQTCLIDDLKIQEVLNLGSNLIDGSFDSGIDSWTLTNVDLLIEPNGVSGNCAKLVNTIGQGVISQRCTISTGKYLLMFAQKNGTQVGAITISEEPRGLDIYYPTSCGAWCITGYAVNISFDNPYINLWINDTQPGVYTFFDEIILKKMR